MPPKREEREPEQLDDELNGSAWPSDAELGRVEQEPTPEPAAPARPQPPAATHLVHLYEIGKFVRTVDRKFTEPLARAFATEYSRSNKNAHREALALPAEAEPPAYMP